jgi:hypothetical protein
MRPQVFPQRDIVAPERTVFLNQMQMIRSRLASAEEFSTGHASLAAVFVTRTSESDNIVVS